MPGPLFVRPDAKEHVLPAGTSDSLIEHAIRIGDMLVVADPDRTDLSDLLLQSRGIALAISGQRKPGWRVMGVLVAQFRKYPRNGPKVAGASSP